MKLGQKTRRPEVMRLLFAKLEALSALSSHKERIAVSAVDVRTEAYPRLLPHRAVVTLQASFPDGGKGEELEVNMREVLKGTRASLSMISDRPALPKRQNNQALFNRLKSVADRWEIPLTTDSSLWPSVAGLIPEEVPVVCGIGPVARGLSTGQEAVSRISLIQHTLLLSEFLLEPQ